MNVLGSGSGVSPSSCVPPADPALMADDTPETMISPNTISIKSDDCATGAEVPTVKVGMRSYVGRYTAATREFLGIEYSQQPIGALRWFPAQTLPVKPLSRLGLCGAHS